MFFSDCYQGLCLCFSTVYLWCIWTWISWVYPVQGFEHLEFECYFFVKFRKFSTIISFFRFHLFFPQTLNFLFCIRVYPVNNVVVVSGEQRRDSAIHIHVSIFPQPLFLQIFFFFSVPLTFIFSSGTQILKLLVLSHRFLELFSFYF